MTTISLFDPCNLPYGPLSNLYPTRLSFSGAMYSSVTQYIYTNMIPSTRIAISLKRDLSVTEADCDDGTIPIDFLNLYQSARREAEVDIISSALSLATQAKFSNSKAMEVLLSTGNKDIIYDSTDEVLGIGKQKKGRNLVGWYLMQVRDEYRRVVESRQIIEARQVQMYTAYVLYSLLQDLITHGDTLRYYTGQPRHIHDLVEKAKTLEDLEKLYVNEIPMVSAERQQRLTAQLNDMASLRFFFDSGTANDPLYTVAIENPVVIVSELRKKFLRTVKSTRDFYIKNEVVKLYLNYIISKNYPNLPESEYAKAREQQLASITGEKYDTMAETIIRNKANLPAPLTIEIDTLLQNNDMPSEEEVKFAESFQLLVPPIELPELIIDKGDVSANDFTIVVMKPDGVGTRLVVTKDTRLENLKNQLGLKVPSYQLRFTYNNKILRSNRTIEQLGIKNGSVLEVHTAVIVPAGTEGPNFEVDLQLLENADGRYKWYHQLRLLSPFAFTGMMSINGLLYPTVMHYILTSRIAAIWSVANTRAAYLDILKDPTDAPSVNAAVIDETVAVKFKKISEIETEFRQKRNIADGQRLVDLATKALDEKFSTRFFQDLLLRTENAVLLWESKDPVLGEPGNFVGRYLMKIRTRVFDIQAKEGKTTVDTENLINIMGNDAFLLEWLDTQVKNVIFTARKVVNYTDVKYGNKSTSRFGVGLQLDLSPRVIGKVADIFFSGCVEISDSANLSTEVPLYFVTIVRKYVKRDIPLVSQTLWKNIAALVWIVVNSIPGLSLNELKSIISKSQIALSSDSVCVPILPQDSEGSCILSALINILHKIIQFNSHSSELAKVSEVYARQEEFVDAESNTVKYKSVVQGNVAPKVDTSITAYDVRTAVSILLNTPVSQKADAQERLADIIEEVDVDQVEVDQEEGSESAEIDYEGESEGEVENDGAGGGRISARESRTIKRAEKLGISLEDMRIIVLQEEADRTRKIKEKENVVDAEMKGKIGIVSAYLINHQTFNYQTTDLVNGVLEEVMKSYVVDNDYHAISQALVAGVNTVNESRVAPSVKLNRINFFATLMKK